MPQSPWAPPHPSQPSFPAPGTLPDADFQINPN